MPTYVYVDILEKSLRFHQFMKSAKYMSLSICDKYSAQYMSAKYIKHNHMLRKPANWEYTTIHLGGLTNVGERARQRASNKKKEVSEALIEMLKARFVSFEDPIFDEMK